MTRFSRFSLFTALTAAFVSAQTYRIDTVAGGGPAIGSPAIANPARGCAVPDAAGNLYICTANQVLVYDHSGTLIRKIGNGAQGYGFEGIQASAASLNRPLAVAVDAGGNIFVVDSGNQVVRKVSAATWVISRVAGNGGGGYSGDGIPAASSSLNLPAGVALDRSGNLFIADTNNNRIRRVAADTGIITTVAGNGTAGYSGDGGSATTAALNQPNGVTLDSTGNLYIADTMNNAIRRVAADTGIITTFAGTGTGSYTGDGGPATAASIYLPGGVAADSSGNVWIADTHNQRIRMVASGTGVITSVAGNGGAGFSGDGGPATAASLSSPTSVSIDSNGNLFITDLRNDRIRKVTAATQIITTVSGTGSGAGGDGGPATEATFSAPSSIALDPNGNLLVADTDNYCIRKVDASSGRIATVAGSGIYGDGSDGPATQTLLTQTFGVAVNSRGDLYFSSGNRIHRLAAGAAGTTTVAGGGFGPDGGPAVGASMLDPYGVAVDGTGNLFIAEAGSNRVRKVAAATGLISTVAGNGSGLYGGDGSPATAASLNFPRGIAVDANGNLFIADYFNNRIRKVVAATGIITTVAGNGAGAYGGDGGPAIAAALSFPTGVALDRAGNLFIADYGNHRVRRVDAVTGIISTVAGDGIWGSSGDGGIATAASLAYPADVVVDPSGRVWVVEEGGNRVRRLTPPTFAADHTTLNFGARPNGTSPVQTINLTASPGLTWTATPSSANIQVTPPNGSGSAVLSISVSAGSSGTVVLTGALAQPITINVNITNLTAANVYGSNPSNTVGSVDQPAASQTTGFAGAIPVTGWALDDVGVAKVSLYREIVAHDSPASVVYLLGHAYVPIGDAIFLPNTRPDVNVAYPAAPLNDRAGWGMLFLTNTTLNNNGSAGYGGNGTYVLHIIATNAEGYQFELGKRTVTIDNAHSPLPFGTIDTPAQGEQVALSAQYVNFGWALTNQPNFIPTDGSTMFVSLDGANAGRPTYGFPRADIDSLFPGYQNTGKAIGYFYIDTTKLNSGIHSIAWSVRDSGGNLQGIGSRVFYVTNPAPPAVAAVDRPMSREAAYRTGPDFEAPLKPLPDLIRLQPGERLEVHTGRELDPDQALPAGSKVEGDVFYWQPPIMALGDFSIALKTVKGSETKLKIRIALTM